MRAEVGRKRAAFGDTLVSVTGAGSGIGRETALAFAREGAELIVSDIDEASAKETAAQIAARGGIAHAYMLDVSDAEAVERFAEQVCAEHGVPDIVVNNAGVGQAGEFLDTPADQWDRVLDINLGGVVNGCRAFGRRLVERGTGGHIVNVASMAAYSPSKIAQRLLHLQGGGVHVLRLSARRTRRRGIGLTTICPGTIDTNIVHTTRFDVPAGQTRAGRERDASSWRGVRGSALRSGQGRQGDRIRGEEEQADPAGHPGGVPALRQSRSLRRRCAARPAASSLASSSRSAAMSSSTANIVRVGTPVPPLPV